MTPIAEVPTPEQASEISNVRYKLAKSPDIEVVGESDTRYRLAGTTTTEDADVKGVQPPVSPLQSTHVLSERVKALVSTVPQSEMPERILRMKRNGKCIACGFTDAWSSAAEKLVRHRIGDCPGTGSGARTEGISTLDYISANLTCTACGCKVDRKNLATLAYHKLYHGCAMASKEEFDLFKGLVFTDSDFPEDSTGGIDLSFVESEFSEQINDQTWIVPETVYRSIAKYISNTTNMKTGNCAGCAGYVPKHGDKSKLGHLVSACPATGSGQRAKNFFMVDYVNAYGMCLSCNELIGLNTPRHLLSHKLIDGCKTTNMKELIYLMSLVFKNDEDIISMLKEGLTKTQSDSLPQRATNRRAETSEVTILATTKKAEAKKEKAVAVQESPFYREMKAQLLGLVEDEKCKACGESVASNHNIGILRAIISHKLHGCTAINSARLLDGKSVPLFFTDGKCLRCGKAGSFKSWRDLLHHKLLAGCAKDCESECNFFKSLVFSDTKQEPVRLETSKIISRTASQSVDPIEAKGCHNDAMSEIFELFENDRCKVCGEYVELPMSKSRCALTIIAHRINNCRANDKTKLMTGKQLSHYINDKECLQCGKTGWFNSWRDLAYHKLVGGCGNDGQESDRNFFRSLVFTDHLKSTSRPKALVADSRNNMTPSICALIEDEHCKACGEFIGPIRENARSAGAIIAHKFQYCPAINSTKLMADKTLSLFAKGGTCMHCNTAGGFTGWRHLIYHKLVGGCSKDQDEKEFFFSLVFSGKELDSMLPEKALLPAESSSQKYRPMKLANPPAPTFAVDPEALYLSRNTGDTSEEVCRACKGLSGPGDHMDWNKNWIGCVECGEAYHRTCVHSTGLFNVTILPKPCNPLKLTAETNWTCPTCSVCAECEGTSNVKQCIECRKMECSKCSQPRKETIWSGQYYTCSSCRPSCISCSNTLGDQRAQDSLMCRRCQVNWVKGLHCPTCLKAYSEDDEGEFPMIQCEGCSVWVHFPCTGLSAAELKRFEGAGCKDVYKCPKCKPLQVETVPRPCAACQETGAQQYIAPGILAHTQCASLAKHLFRTGVPPHGPLVERKGTRSVGLGTIQLRTWDIKPSVSGPPRSRHTWTLTLPTKEGDSYSIKSDGLSKHGCEGGTLEEVYASLRELLSRQSVEQHRIDGILGHFEEGCKRLAQLNVPSKRAPEPTIVIDTEEQPAKRLRRKKNSSTDSLPYTPDSFLDRCTEDPLSCARTRGQCKGVPKPPIVPFRDDPVESAVDSFNANFVPIRSDKLGQYRTATLPMAYRLMGSKQIEKGDLVAARSGIAGYGLFAGRKYIPNELVIEYQGQIIGQALADWRESRLPAYKQSCYMFRLDDARIIDATVIGNAARFINHCCQPNCRTKPVMVEGQPRILIIAKKEIAPGEELSYDYQFALDEDDGKGRLPCYCGARKCRGWMN